MSSNIKPKVLFVVDVENWAYDDRAKHWQRLLADEFDIEITYLKPLKPLKLRPLSQEANRLFNQLIALSDYEGDDSGLTERTKALVSQVKSARSNLLDSEPVFDHRDYDGILFFYSKALRDKRLISTPVPGEKAAVCINNEKWELEGGAKQALDNYFSEAKIIVGCNQHIVDSFSSLHPCVMRASQSVDPNTFKTERDDDVRKGRIGSKFVVGWSGDYKNPIKNVDLIKEAVELANVKILISKNRTREELNNWYNETIDAVVCASTAEGGPLMLLEAGACTRPVITAPVGLAREIIKGGETGLIFPHGNKEKLADAMQLLAEDTELREKLADNLHQEIVNNWTYEARIHEIRSVPEETVPLLV